jgi:hypothetical protein
MIGRMDGRVASRSRPLRTTTRGVLLHALCVSTAAQDDACKSSFLIPLLALSLRDSCCATLARVCGLWLIR